GLDYKLQLGFHQNGWSGGVGVFFQLQGWNPRIHGPGWQCYVLTISQSKNSKDSMRHRVELARVEKSSSGGSRDGLQVVSLGSQPLSGIVGEVMVELNV